MVANSKYTRDDFTNAVNVNLLFLYLFNTKF